MFNSRNSLFSMPQKQPMGGMMGSIVAGDQQSMPNPFNPTMPQMGVPGGNPGGPEPHKGFDWKRAIGIFGDAMAGFAGQAPQYGPMMEQRRREAAAEQRAQANRYAENQDWYAHEAYKAANTPPKVNDTVEDFNWFKGLSDEDKVTYAQMHPQWQAVQNDDGTKTIVPVVPGMGMDGPVPTRPVGKLTPIAGGPMPSASGGFR